MNRLRVIFPFILMLTLVSAGWAQLGQPSEQIVESLSEQVSQQDARESDDGWYVGADGFRFRIIDRGGLAFRVEGQGQLTAEGIAFAAQVIAAASGLGEDIVGPVESFFTDQAPELSGQGRVAVGLASYVLSLEVGDGPPFDVDFSLSFTRVDPESFPAARHTLGPADATYVIREFSDFQCPFCANYALEALPFIKGALLERGDVRFEYHHFPLQSIHANAVPAAEAAECVAEANDPDAFWTFHDALFERQRAWAQLGEPAPYFVRLAAELDLSIEGVQACLDERRHAEHVQQAYAAAAGDLRISGTPTVFVNGFRLSEFLDLEAYLAMFDRLDAFAQEESAYMPGAAED